MKRWFLFACCIALLGVTLLILHNRSRISFLIYNSKLNIVEETIDASSFYKLINMPATPWMMHRIQKDLQAYQTHPITQRRLDRTYRALQHKPIARFQIRNSQLTYQTTVKRDIRFLAMKDGLKNLVKLYPHLNVDFIIALEDGVEMANAPVFVFTKSMRNHSQILIPDFTCFAKKSASSAWIHSLKPRLQSVALETPWEERLDQCMWRGASSGTKFSHGMFSLSSRCKLCSISKYHPDFVDAKFTDSSHIPPEYTKAFTQEYPIAPFIPPERHLDYKYLICIDGNTCSYPGMHWRLLSGSLILKPDSDQIQWYYEGLRPGYHYLSIEKDLANLLPSIAWARHNDEHAKQIAMQAREFANENLSQEAIYRYLCLVLREYQKVYMQSHLAMDYGW